MFKKLKETLLKRKKQDSDENSYDSEIEKNNSKENLLKVEIDQSKVFKKTSTDNSGLEGFDWFSDRYRTLINQRNTMIFLLLSSIVSLTILSLVVIFLFKNKSIEPFIIEVDKKTGFVTFLKKDNKIIGYSENESIRNYFIKKYLDSRETLDTKNFNYFYNKVVPALSSPAVLRQFNFLLRSNEKSNPFIAYENNLECKIVINSITEIGDKTVQVRFTVEVLSSDNKRLRFNKIATLNYEFVNYEMDQEIRYINPLGFLITNYRVVDENF
jgi:type IV secretion system protein VirB8